MRDWIIDNKDVMIGIGAGVAAVQVSLIRRNIRKLIMIGPDKQFFKCKIVSTFLPISLNLCFG